MARRGARSLTCLHRALLGASVGGLGLLTLACAAHAQSPAAGTTPQAGFGQDSASTPTPPATSTSPSDPGYQPGFIDAFGRFIGDSAAKLGDSAAKLNSQLGSKIDSARESLDEIGNHTSDAAKNAVGAAKDTAGAIVGLPGERVAEGRERCAMAANGAADCRPAADSICRAKGFSAGRILDTRAEEKCPASVWLSHVPKSGECPVETFVTRAVCQ